MSLNEAYDVLERYYVEQYNFLETNYYGYEVDVAYTKSMLEGIIDKRGELSAEEVIFLKSLLDDGLSGPVEEAVEEILAWWEMICGDK